MRSTTSQPDATSVAPLAAVMEDQQPLYTKRETLLTVLGVLMVMLLASLDHTNVRRN